MYQKVDKDNYYVIQSLSMANHLVRSGFDIKKVSDNEVNPKFKVFLFSDSSGLREAMSDFNS